MMQKTYPIKSPKHFMRTLRQYQPLKMKPGCNDVDDDTVKTALGQYGHSGWKMMRPGAYWIMKTNIAITAYNNIVEFADLPSNIGINFRLHLDYVEKSSYKTHDEYITCNHHDKLVLVTNNRALVKAWRRKGQFHGVLRTYWGGSINFKCLEFDERFFWDQVYNGLWLYPY